MPAWLAAEGVPAAEIAEFLGIILLPWAFKLLVGPLMDHFEFLPMGKRRPWVLGAQLGMVASLLSLALLDNPSAQLGLLTGIGFLINVFTATQEMWSNTTYVLVMMATWILLLPIIMVCVLALAMSICSVGESATQFAIYMSVCNLGATAGSFFYGMVADITSWPQSYALKGLLVFALLVALLLFRTHGHPEDLLNEEAG